VADVSVRPAAAGDVPEIARVQVATWAAAYADVLPAAVLAAATRQRAEAEWSAAVTAPPSAAHRVLVAFEQEQLVGFAAFGPAVPDETVPDETVSGGTAPAAGAAPAGAEMYALLVEPRWGRRGHGSRLLAATVDTLRQSTVDTLVAWVLDADVASTRFYTGAGWEPDGYVRSLVGDGRTVREARWHVSLAESESDGEGER
jgi:GNAT superfamily N-acetyltransferase